MSDRFTVQWAQTAVDNLLNIIGSVDARGRQLGDHALSLRVVPELEAEGIDGYRGLLVGPYRLLFAVRGGEVVLLTAPDGRRDLGELLTERALRQRD